MIDEAKKIFQSITARDSVVYTAMSSSFSVLFNSSICPYCVYLVNAYGRSGMALEAIDLYHKMPESSRNSVTHTCVLNACSHSGLVDDARSIFNKIKVKTEKIITVMVFILTRHLVKYGRC